MNMNIQVFLRSMGLALVLITASQLQACAEESDTGKSYSQLDQFWSEFRTAAIRGDKTTLLQLTKFPFATRGTMDDDPVIYLDRKAFNKNIDTILAQDPGDPSTPKPETMLDLFKRTKTVKDEGGGFFRVGDLEYMYVNGRWLWVKAYIDESEIK